MSDLSTRRMLAAYREMAGAPMFLASHFKTGPRDIHNSAKVEVDVRRSGRPIAIAIKDWKSGGRMNTIDLFTNKEHTPAIFYEEFSLNQGNLMERQMGEESFKDPDFMEAAQNKLSDGVQLMTEKVRRSLELQAAQILQTGTVDLRDEDNDLMFTIDFDMKAAHKYGASVDWDETNADPYRDMTTGDGLTRKNGKHHIDRWVFGDNAWASFLENEKIQELLDNRRMQLGGIAPEMMSEDQVYMGWMIVNGVKADLFTYQGSYDDPVTGNDTPYVSPWNVIGLSTKAKRVLTFGGIPRLVKPDPRVAALGIGSMLAMDRGLVLTTNAWTDARGETIFGSVATRALAIPTAIDCHVCINAKVS